jgi:hypothetical protein
VKVTKIETVRGYYDKETGRFDYTKLWVTSIRFSDSPLHYIMTVEKNPMLSRKVAIELLGKELKKLKELK